MAPVTRNYKIKDVDMLVTSSTIIENAIRNKTFLQSKRSNWADPFFEDLQKRINDATQNFLGVDSAKDLRQATQVITEIQKQSLSDLSELKVQLNEDFRNDKARRDEILNNLGFTSFHKDAKNKYQEALIQLLFQFKKNLTAGVKDEIVTKGTARQVLDNITGYADTLLNANISQESFKGLRKTITAEAITEFNQIYDQVISMSKIASRFYKGKIDMRGQFGFSTVSKALNKQPKAEIPPTK